MLSNDSMNRLKYAVASNSAGTESANAINTPIPNMDGGTVYYVNSAVTASCLRGIVLPARAATITGNTIAEYGVAPSGSITQLLTMGMDLSGTAGGANAVWSNQLGGTYSATLYKVGASGDQWGGNFNVITGGVTAANPA